VWRTIVFFLIHSGSFCLLLQVDRKCIHRDGVHYEFVAPRVFVGDVTFENLFEWITQELFLLLQQNGDASPSVHVHFFFFILTLVCRGNIVNGCWRIFFKEILKNVKRWRMYPPKMNSFFIMFHVQNL